MTHDERWAFDLAVEAARQSGCQKSQRGVVIWHRHDGQYCTGFNFVPAPSRCDGSDVCLEHCPKRAVHAEQSALLMLWRKVSGVPPRWLELLHVETVDGQPVPSPVPRCWQCSKLILEAGIGTVWLQAEPTDQQPILLVRYSAVLFHLLTLQNNQTLTDEETDMLRRLS